MLEDVAADFGESEAVGGRIELLDAACILNGLQGDATNARLGEGVVDDFADFVVVEAFAKGGN